MPLYPVFLKLDGRLCMVAGAGRVALEKIQNLLHAGARLRVVAPEANAEIVQLHAAGALDWSKRCYRPEDFNGVSLAIAATDNREVNRQVFAEAGRRGIWCNTVDDPPLCDFFSAAVVERGDLQIAISTAGKSPAVAQRLKRELDRELAPDLGRWLDSLGSLRREILALVPPGESRKQLLHALAQREVCPAPECPARRDALAAAARLQEQAGEAAAPWAARGEEKS